MNQTFLRLSKLDKTPARLSGQTLKIYQSGMALLGRLLGESFLDVPAQPVDGRFSHDGLYYAVTPLNDRVIMVRNNTYTLLTLFKVTLPASYCPLRIDITFKDARKPGGGYVVALVDLSGRRPVRKDLVRFDGERFTARFKGLESLTLSGLAENLIH